LASWLKDLQPTGDRSSPTPDPCSRPVPVKFGAAEDPPRDCRKVLACQQGFKGRQITTTLGDTFIIMMGKT
jgi:hypothetical protein